MIRKITRLVVGLGCLAALQVSAQAVPESLPDGVTGDMIQEGAAVFQAAGLCAVCHGPEAQGQPGLGPNLTDDEWLHSDGSYTGLVEQIMAGVTADESTTGLVMPPKGGGSITDDQVRAVAAYVWSLNQQGN